MESKKLIAIIVEDGCYFELEERVKSDKFDIDVEKEIYDDSQASVMGAVYNLGFQTVTNLSPSVVFIKALASQFIHDLSRMPEVEFLRENTMVLIANDTKEKLFSKMPFIIGNEWINDEWFDHMYQELSMIFSKEIQSFDGSVESYLATKREDIHLAGRVYFHLVENKGNDFPFAFLATYCKADDHKKVSHTVLKNALIDYKDDRNKILSLLATVNKVIKQSKMMSDIVESGEIFQPLKFTTDDAFTFLKEVALYEECGIVCRIPDWWKKRSKRGKISVKVGEGKPSRIGFDQLISFEPEILYGDEVMTQEELQALLGTEEGLRLIKGKWIEVNHERLKKTIEAYKQAKKLAEMGDFTMAEAMRWQLDESSFLDRVSISGVDIEVTHGEWLKSTFAQLRSFNSSSQVLPTDMFNGNLRVYQGHGLNWLYMMQNIGFGACLADDMGLGKTVQIIALLDKMKAEGLATTLLVVPASLMGNWEKELDNFAPHINKYLIYNKKDFSDDQSFNDVDIVITTYGMLARLEGLREEAWDMFIIDEAQAIKNPSTKQTKAVKSVNAKRRIALTGTPIENQLLDLWSLFDFLNTGLLGSMTEFKRWMKKMTDGNIDYGKLRTMINPFILRRLKTDKSIIQDLPDKVEMKTYTSLSKKQVALYKKSVKSLMKDIEEADGIKRKGLVLSSINQFKQICNHPDHYLGGGDYTSKHSGKFEMLGELCETIASKHEKVIVFTQYREMIQPIHDFMKDIFHKDGLIIHGGTPVKKRGDIVDTFQEDPHAPFIVISLKAGGTGLTLTAANHVVHFDRWWNPAVENQATDRAFRIGQEKNVMVYKFITKGTIEERIDEMIDDKSKLVEEVVTDGGGQWITELDNQQLKALFTLDI